VTPFARAVESHAVVRRAAAREPERAAALWAAVSGGPVAAGVDSYATAAAATAPVKHAALLGADDVAGAFAFATLWAARPYDADALSPVALRDHARRAWVAFEKRAEGVDEVQYGFGCSREAAWQSFADVSASDGNMDAVRRVAALAGRMYAAMAGSETRRVHGVVGEVYDVQPGRELSRMLPLEIARLGHPVLRAQAVPRILQGQALTYAMRGPERTASGPLVLALDESGSMHGARREWSKAAAVALARVAHDQKRLVRVVHFSTAVRERDLPPGDAKATVAMIRSMLHGGTDIALAVDRSAAAVESMSRAGQKGADVVLVTDGVDEEVGAQRSAVERLRATGARLWTVAIECTIAPESPLRAAAQTYVEVGRQDLNAAVAARLVGAAVGQRKK